MFELYSFREVSDNAVVYSNIHHFRSVFSGGANSDTYPHPGYRVAVAVYCDVMVAYNKAVPGAQHIHSQVHILGYGLPAAAG